MFHNQKTARKQITMAHRTKSQIIDFLDITDIFKNQKFAQQEYDSDW